VQDLLRRPWGTSPKVLPAAFICFSNASGPPSRPSFLSGTSQLRDLCRSFVRHIRRNRPGLARVLPFARMRIHGGAVAHARAESVPALGFPFAGVQPRQTCFYPSSRRDRACHLFSRMALQAVPQHPCRKGSHRQFAKVAPRQGCVCNYLVVACSSFLRLMISKTSTPRCAVHPSISPGFDSSRREIFQSLAGRSKSSQARETARTQSGDQWRTMDALKHTGSETDEAHLFQRKARTRRCGFSLVGYGILSPFHRSYF